MKAFYEKFREDCIDIKVFRNKNHTYAPHFHSNLEIFIVKKGTYSIVLNDEEIEIKDGAIVVFDSYCIHGYNRIGEGERDDCVVVIPSKYINDFKPKGYKIKQSVILDKTLADKLLTVCDEYLSQNTSECVKSAAVNLFIAQIKDKLTFEKDDSLNGQNAIHSILAYISDNYLGDLTLDNIAYALGYSKEHISRVFHKFVNVSIPVYINNLRIEYVYKNKSKNKNLTNLIFEAGFKSVQTYYRCKKEYDKLNK